MKGKLILASNLPAKDEAKPTKVVGAKMQRFCNCDPSRVAEAIETKVDAGASSRLKKAA